MPPPPPFPGSFLYFQIESKTEKHCHCRGLINIKLCARKKNFKNSAVTTHKVMRNVFLFNM